VRSALAPRSGLPGDLLSGLRPEIAVATAGAALATARALRRAQTCGNDERGCGMSAALAVPCVIATATAVAAADLPVARPKPIIGFAFYRKHTLALLHRYLRLSMELGRAPSMLGKLKLQGRVSSYRLRTFEDGLIFVLDVEKCIDQLDKTSRAIVAHVVLEDYTTLEAGMLTGESQRSATRIYSEALNRLTALFLQFGLLEPNVENLSRGEAKTQSNETT
jgi:hypothetical protein